MVWILLMGFLVVLGMIAIVKYRTAEPTDAHRHGQPICSKRDETEPGDDFRALLASAKRGNADAQYCVGWRYGTGRGVEKDEDQEFFWYEKAAAQGCTDASIALGGLYAVPCAKRYDLDRALKIYQEAANEGSMWGKLGLADFYAGPNTKYTDYDGAESLYLEIANADDADCAGIAALRLGSIYRCIKKNHEKALYWLYQADRFEYDVEDAIQEVMRESGITLSKKTIKKWDHDFLRRVYHQDFPE